MTYDKYSDFGRKKFVVLKFLSCFSAREKKKQIWVFTNAVTFALYVSKDITYTKLMDKVYKTIDVDR